MIENSKNIYLSLGSNLGDRLSNLLFSIDKLKKIDNFIIHNISSIYETEPVGPKDQNNFYNLAVKAEYDGNPNELLIEFKKIENEMGRIKNEKWGSRIIDIDILFYGSLIMESDSLTVPHIELENRKFVLEPLKEIASDFICPKSFKSIDSIANDTIDDSWITRINYSKNLGEYN